MSSDHPQPCQRRVPAGAAGKRLFHGKAGDLPGRRTVYPNQNTHSQRDPRGHQQPFNRSLHCEGGDGRSAVYQKAGEVLMINR